MKIRGIKLKNFKRFTDLIISGIHESARLVLVVGPNGCGKSSLFDAFLHWYRSAAGFGINGDELYFRKAQEDQFDWNQSVRVEIFGDSAVNRGSLYMRTAYRNDADFTINAINQLVSPKDHIRFSRFIDNDLTVSENYQRLVYDTTAAVYDTSNDSKTVSALRHELIGEIRASMKRIFGDLDLENISDPLGAGTFYFQKGTSTSYHYKNLSGGEKAAFDLILDLHIKKKYYQNSIYCIDEVETHLHTKIQGSMVKEMLRVVPETSQLWINTHSLGVLQAAQEIEFSCPGTVCVIDFDGINLDVPSEIFPSSLGRVTWDKMLSMAIGDLSKRVAPKFVIICEGSSIGSRRKDFDAEIYNRIFGAHIPEVLFISGGSSQELVGSGARISKSLDQILPNTKVIALADRDDKSNAEVTNWEKEGNITLEERNIESYLLADDVLLKLACSVGREDLVNDVLEIKRNALSASISRGHPSDDFKSASGEIYTQLRTLLNLRRSGNNKDAFLRDTLAPLVEPDMNTYLSLKACIIDKIIY